MKGKENAALYTAYHTKTEEVMAEVENGLANIKAGIEDKAFDEFYMAMKGTIEAPLSSKTYKKAVQMLEDKARQQAKTFATNLTEAQLNTMAQTIADGLKEGLGTQQISRRLTMVSGLDSGRAATYQKYIDDLAKSGVTGKRLQRLSEKRFNQLLKDRRWTIAQTEARVATSHAREKEAQAFGAKYKVWMTVGDDRVSEQCRSNQAEGPIPLKDAFPSGHSRPPCHPNCVLPGMGVFAPDRIRTYSACFKGPVVKFFTEPSGWIAVTPNHMLLTSNGLRPAESLCEGDYVVYCPLANRASLRGPDDNNRPTMIEEVVRAFSMPTGMATITVPTSPEYLHGDGRFIDGNIDVVSINSLLGGEGEVVLGQSFHEIPFNAADTKRFGFSCCRDFTAMLIRMLHTANGSVGFGGKGAALFGGHASHSDDVGFASVSDGNASLEKAASDSWPTNPNGFGQAQLRLSSDVAFTNQSDIHRFSPSVPFNATLPDGLVHPGVTTSNSLSDFINENSGFVQFTRILSIRFGEMYYGHVYDLQTCSSLYAIHGVISSNCRCTLGYSMSKKQADLIHKEIEEMSAGDQITQTPVEKPKPKTIKIKQEKINGAIEQLNKTIPDIQVGADAAIQPEAGGIIGRQEWGIKPFAQENTLIESRSTAKVIGELSREIYSDESILRMELQDNSKRIADIKKSIASGGGNNFNPTHVQKATLKIEVNQRIAKATGLTKQEIREVIDAWAESSTEGTSSLTQKAAENLFGIKYGAKLSNYHDVKFKAHEALLKRDSIDVDEKIKCIENILNAMYEETQRELARRGIKTVKLLRGTGEIKEYANNAIMRKKKTIQTKLGPLQSFTSNPIVAQGFKNIMIVCEVPAERILSMPTTGMGCWNESEYVVIGDGLEEFGYVIFQ